MNDEEKPAPADEDVVEVDLSADAGLLVGLVEKTAADPGAPFAPEILASLADLRKTDRAAFETLPWVRSNACLINIISASSSVISPSSVSGVFPPARAVTGTKASISSFSSPPPFNITTRSIRYFISRTFPGQG